MKIFDGQQPQNERLVRMLAAVSGCAVFVLLVLVTITLVASLQASASAFSTLDAAIAAVALFGLMAAGLITRHIFKRGSAGARQVGSLLTDTAPGQIFSGLAGLLLAIASISTVIAAHGWASWIVSALSALFWSGVGVRELRNGWRRWASQRATLHNGPAIERIPE